MARMNIRVCMVAICGLLLGAACATRKEDRRPEPVAVERSGFSISGRVLTKDGRGIGGARVFAYRHFGFPWESRLEKLLCLDEVQNVRRQPPPETVSAKDGSYRFDDLDWTCYMVKAIAAGFSPQEKEDILPTRTVVDFWTNEGIAGVKVWAYTHADEGDVISIIQTRSRPPFDVVTTGPGGAFRFDTLGSGVYSFLVTAQGYQDGEFIGIKTDAGWSTQVPFAIARGLTIAGTVLSPSNEPVAGAKMRATRIGGGGGGGRRRMLMKCDDGSVTSDLQGRFAFGALEPGKYTLLAWHPDYATEQRRDIDAGGAEVSIVLPFGGAVAGVIAEARSGNPIAGALVSVSDVQDLRKEGLTDEHGRFYVPGVLKAGTRFLNIRAEGYARLANLPVRLKEDGLADSLRYELQRTAVVAGRVVNLAGQGIAIARLFARRNALGSIIPITIGRALTAEDGSYAIKDLEPGEATVISVVTSDYLDGTSAPFAVLPGEAIHLPDVVLRLGGMVKGVVVGPDGRGKSGVRITPRLRGGTLPRVDLGAVTDREGVFFLKGLPSGMFYLIAESQHEPSEVLGGVEVVEGSVTPDVRIVLDR